MTDEAALPGQPRGATAGTPLPHDPGSSTQSGAFAAEAPLIALDRVSKSFLPRKGGTAIDALRDVTFSVPEGSFTTILGPSGCGKTTLLRLVNGLIAPDAGTIQVRGQAPVPGPGIGFVFQSFRLLPWRNVLDNVAFPLEMTGITPGERRERARQALALVGLGRFADSYPGELSGGMKQRVALARALVGEPSLLLMDEPFASLDAQTRELMQVELSRLWRERGCAVVFVTHSVDEAVLLGERVVLMAARPGRVAEIVEVRPEGPASPEAARADPAVAALRTYLWERIKAMVLSDPASDFYGRG